MKTYCLWITLMLTVGVTTTGLRADTFDCVRFLENYLNEIVSERRQIPLQDGELPTIAGSERLLGDAAAVRAYLEKNPTSPWTRELEAYAKKPIIGTVIYLSEVGPTAWNSKDLNAWIKMVRQGAVIKAGRARALLHKIGYARDNIPLVSDRAHEYVRTANYVSQIRALTQLEKSMIKIISELEPKDGAKARELLDIPYRQRRLTRYVFSPTGPYQERGKSERNREMPHFGIDFEVEKLRANPLAPALRVQSSAGALWAARALLREPLIRRKLSVEGGTLKILGQRLSGEQILWLSVFPELAPHWRLARMFKMKLKYINLSRPLNNEYSRLLSVPINASDDTLNLNLHRREWMENSPDEPLGVSLTLDASGEPGGEKRVRAWAMSEWPRLDAFGDLVRQARLTLKKSQVRITNLTPAQALALFAHLQNIYGEPWQ